MKPISANCRPFYYLSFFNFRFVAQPIRKKYLMLSFVVVFTVVSGNLFGQKATSFFEPGISITYDTATVRVTKRDASIFRIKSEKIEIRVSAEPPVNEPGRINKIPISVSELRSYVQNGVQRLNQNPGAFPFSGWEITDYDKKLQKVGDFLCYGYVQTKPKTNEVCTIIYVFHISENAYTRIYVDSYEKKSLSEHYKQLENFLAGFKTYTKAELLNHDLLNAKKYTVVVNKADKIMPDFEDRPGAYLAVVSTKEKLEDKVKEVFLTSSAGTMAEKFSPAENGKVYIALDAKMKGVFEAKGEFRFYSSIGKLVRVPFSFQYEIK